MNFRPLRIRSHNFAAGLGFEHEHEHDLGTRTKATS
jgi:hypothetical protein